MKRLFLFELIGFLAIGSLVIPSLQLIASDKPLPERVTYPDYSSTSNEDELLAQVEFDGQAISFYYSPTQFFDNGIYYSAGTGKVYSFEQKLMHNHDRSLYFYADFGNYYEFTADGILLDPVEILTLHEQEVAIYHLPAAQEIRRKHIGKQNYQSVCTAEIKCKETVYTDLDEFESMVSTWTPVDEIEIKAFGRDFEPLISIQNNWEEHIVHQGQSFSHSIELSFLQTIENKYYIKLFDGNISYYRLNSLQLDQFFDFLNQ